MLTDKNEFLNNLLDNMTIDDMCGQLLCYEVSKKWSVEDFERVMKETKAGAIYVHNFTANQIKQYTDIANKYSEIPVIVAADVENGPGCCMKDEVLFPHQIAWGACDVEGLIESAGEITAQICRKAGIHWSFSPVVDINYNPNNPVVNIRSISDSPHQVAKIACATIRGMQKNGILMACGKHFPGDGVDDRNQHFCTTINSFGKQEWDETFGMVYKKIIDEGVATIMSAHIALPCYDEKVDEILGYKPASLSYNLQTKLLKEKLGFQGCIVSDAMSMVGACSMVALDRLAVEFIKTGGDIMLFPTVDDFTYIKNAVISGEISQERLRDAVMRVMILKYRARLFENQGEVLNVIKTEYDAMQISDEIARKSVKIVRNSQHLLPLKLKSSAKILIIKLQNNDLQINENSLETLEKELNYRGIGTTVLVNGVNASHYEIARIKDEYDCILICCKVGTQDYINGGSLRVGWSQFMAFWRGIVLNHPCVIFASFGDPYKLYEFPYLKTYVNVFSSCESSQRAFVELMFGEIPMVAKNPVGLKNFFDRETD